MGPTAILAVLIGAVLVFYKHHRPVSDGKNRSVAALLAVSLLFSMCACSNSSDEPEIDDSANLEQSESGGSDSKDKSDGKAPSSAETTKPGRTSRMTVYGANDEVYYRHEHVYDGNGNMISVTSYNGSGEETGHVDIIYDEHGNKLVDYLTRGVGHTYYNGVLFPEVNEQTGAVSPIEQKYTMEPEYDGSRNLIKRSYYEPSGELYYYEEYEYDGDGNRSCRRQFDENGECYLYEFLEYDTAGNLITRKEYNGWDDTIRYSYVFEYNSEGKEIKSSMYDHSDIDGGMLLKQYTVHEYNDDMSLSKISTFDGDGNPTEYIVYGNGEMVYYEVYEGQEILWTRTVYS